MPPPPPLAPLRRSSDEEAREMATLASDAAMLEQVMLAEDRDDLSPTSHRRDGDLDDAAAGGGLHSSLTGVGPDKLPNWFAQWEQWRRDPRNVTKLRVGVCIAASVLFLIFIVLLVTLTRHSDRAPPPKYDVRLPRSVLPQLYSMQLNASMASFRFDGTMLIDVVFTSATSQILLHAKELQIDQISLTRDQGVSFIYPRSYGYTGQHDLYVINFLQVFPAGATGRLHMRFAGVIEPALAGFYRSNYTTASGEVRTVASTHFESSDARRAFPCFDEPSFKANFSLVILTEDRPDTVVLSNMPGRVDRVAGPLALRTSFDATPPMSTYLVAYVICDFQMREAKTTRGLPVRVWAAKDKIAGVDVALTAAVKAIDAFEELFKLPFPLPKLDNIAIPAFSAGAMENWGLVTYRETALLLFPDSAEASTEQNIVATVSHELAHQWFGDITTLAWWNDLWLNEGGASYWEWMGVKAYSGHAWAEDSQLIADSQASALALDASQYSHPIVQHVGDPDEVDSLFDSISYDKGSSILMMLAAMMNFYENAPNLQAGLHRYFTRHAYGNAASDDLWRAMQAEAPATLPIDLTTVMHGYTTQMGYPLITLKPNDQGDGFVVTQQRFVELPYEWQDRTLRDQQSQYRWDVMLSLASAQGAMETRLMRASDQSLTLPYEPSHEFLYVNKDRFGFYRVAYPDEMWSALANALLDPEFVFSNSDRCGLLDDAWTLALARHAPYQAAFGVSAFLFNSSYPEYTPWLCAMTQLARVSKLVAHDSDTSARFDSYIQRLIASHPFAQAPWNGYDDHLRTLLQQLLVNNLVAHNSTVARAEALRLFLALKNDGEEVNVNMRDAVYRVGVEECSDDSCWQFLWDRYVSSLDPSEKRRILRALTRSRSVATLQRLLTWSLDPTRVSSQDTERLIVYVALNPAGLAPAWAFFKQNYDELYRRYGASSFTFAELLTRVIGQFDSQALIDETRTFFANRPVGTGARALLQAIEAAQINIYWRQERHAEFKQELEKALQQQ